MAIRLTSDLERRIRDLVDAGGYSCTQEALEAAVAAMEIAATPDFDEADELTRLLSHGLESRDLSEQEFWELVDRDADAVLAGYTPLART